MTMTKEMIFKLGELADVRSGLVLSRKQGKEGDGFCYPALNFRAMGLDGTIDRKELDDYRAVEALHPDYVSQQGDVIVRLTAPYTACLIDQALQGMVISSNFVIIRGMGRRLLPEYLFWLLNTRKVKDDIYRNSTSNMLAAVNARYFLNFKIRLIPEPEQRRIAAMNQLARREASLLRRLAETKEFYYSALIDKLQGEACNHD